MEHDRRNSELSGVSGEARNRPKFLSLKSQITVGNARMAEAAIAGYTMDGATCGAVVPIIPRTSGLSMVTAYNNSELDAGPAMVPTDAEVGLKPTAGRRLRLLQVITWFRTGGTEGGVAKLIAGLGYVFEQRVCADRGADVNYAAWASPQHAPFVAGEGKRGPDFPLFRLRKIMRDFRPDIVHTRNWGCIEAIFAARLAGVPIVVHSEHGYEMDNLAGLPCGVDACAV